jgi:hypothetical protein
VVAQNPKQRRICCGLNLVFCAIDFKCKFCHECLGIG